MSTKVFAELLNRRGWSTRYIHTKRKLPMHVNFYPGEGNRRYRICRKLNGETKTLGYFRNVFEAEGYLAMLGWD